MFDNAGLEGVVVARSAVCSIDGVDGTLAYRGYDIRDLAAESGFEETCFLLLYGRLPTAGELEAWVGRLTRARFQHAEETRHIVDLLAGHRVSPMELLRTAVSADATDDPLKDLNTVDANLAKAVGLIARMPVIVARHCRIRAGLEPVEPSRELSHAGNFLWMLHGEEPSDEAVRLFDAAMILHAENELNASTFAARVIASTGSDMHSAITGAIAALKGPLHGGANEQVMALLEEIGEVGMVDEVVRARLASTGRITGFGHRVYRGWDPRARLLRDMARQLAEQRDPKWFRISEEVERTVAEVVGLYPNVAFYAASLYRYLGIPADVFPAVFAISRVAGWTAHVIEQQAANALIRPTSTYTGPAVRSYPPIAERSSAA